MSLLKRVRSWEMLVGGHVRKRADAIDFLFAVLAGINTGSVCIIRNTKRHFDTVIKRASFKMGDPCFGGPLLRSVMDAPAGFRDGGALSTRCQFRCVLLVVFHGFPEK